MILKTSLQRAWWLVLLALGLGVANAQTYLYFTFDPPGATFTSVSGMNNSGQMVGTYQDSAGPHSFLRSSDGVSYTIINVPGASQTTATGINNLGQVVGSYTNGSGGHGFLRSADGTFTSFDAPNAVPYTVPSAINDRGEIVGTSFSALSIVYGFLRSADGLTYTTISAPQGQRHICSRHRERRGNRGRVLGRRLLRTSTRFRAHRGWLLRRD